MASAEVQLRDEFRGEHWFLTHDRKNGFGARFSDHMFGVAQRGGHIIEIPFSYVKHVEVHRTFATSAKTTGGLSVTGALVGGALLGPAGMLLGGTTGKRSTKSKDYLTNLWIQIDVWGPGGGGTESFFLLKSGGPLLSDSILVKTEQLAAQATAVVSQVIRLGAEQAAPPPIGSTPPAIPGPSTSAQLVSFESSVQKALEALGWRLREHSPDCFLGVRGTKRGVFLCDPKVGTAATVRKAFDRHRQFVEATSGALVVGSLMVDGRREAERLGYKVFEFQELLQKARRAPARPAALPPVEGAFNF